jgi:simple sugar transport system permease protein
MRPSSSCSRRFFIGRSFAGFRLDVSGQAPAAARYAGFPENGAIWMGLLIGGAAAGLAGAAELAGPLGRLTDRWTPGFGFTAIIVAALGRLHPLGIALASLLMALLYLGGEAGQIALQLPKAISQVFQGMLLMFLLGCDVLVRYRVQWRAAAQGAAGAAA